MKFRCLDRDGKMIGIVLAKNAKEALENARKLNDNITKVEDADAPVAVEKASKSKKVDAEA